MSKELRPHSPKLHARVAPVFGALGLALVCLGFEWGAPNAWGASLISRPLYGVFLARALLALWLALSQHQNGKVQPSAWWWADVMVCTYVFVPMMQWTIPSPRPPGSPIEELLGLPLNGWPSGHMVSVFALAWALMVACPRLAWPAFAVAVAMGWALNPTRTLRSKSFAAAPLAWRWVGGRQRARMGFYCRDFITL